MDDYYELLGVDEDAPVNDIRSAYRDKKAAVDTSADDDAKAEVAALNKAWNVLSDPYQRGRYDQQRAVASDDDDDGDDDEEDALPVARSRSPRADRAEKRRAAREPLKPTIKIPAGVHFPATKQRLFAMGIDMAILIGIFFVGSLVVLPAVAKAQHPDEYKRTQEITKTDLPAAQDETSAAEKAHSAAEDKVETLTEENASASEIQDAKDAERTANEKLEAAEDAEQKLKDELEKESEVLLPIQQMVTAAVFVVGLFVLVFPTVFGRQTIGKQTQRIRVSRLDGSPARFSDVLRRYGILVLGGMALTLLIGPTGALVAVFVGSLWTRNPNQQGLHDRFAKTLVVADDEVADDEYEDDEYEDDDEE